MKKTGTRESKQELTSWPLRLRQIRGFSHRRKGAKKSKAGVIEFLAKALRDQDLLDAIQVALEKDRVGRQHEAEVALLEDRLQGLTPREREVLGMVVSGMLNKQIASRIGTTENTTRVYRSRVMEKVQAQSLADLVRMAERLQISFPKAS